MSLGISGDVEGEAKVSTNKELDGYAGSLDLSINPVIEGTLVVDTPIFDKNLVQQPLFVKELKPLWSNIGIKCKLARGFAMDRSR